MEATFGPELSRREMLVLAGMVGLAAALPALRPGRMPFPFHISSGAGVAATGGDDLTLARFAPHVGTRFSVRPPALGAVVLTLEEASAIAPHRADRAGLRGESFSLVFRAVDGPPLPDGIHRVHHPALGTFPLFVSAFGAALHGQGYQAIVDRRAPVR
ncbi:MAG TPA: hypothetical protein VMZ73_08215 [Acidimicrobiales bacterium]|nr:hypothetical protein [Acidimicrobiales bacterium]